MSLLRVSDLRTEFRIGSGWHPAVNGVSFTLEKGEILGLVGESGCGKSTVASSLMRLLPGNARIGGGSVRLEGAELTTLPEADIRRLRGRRMGMIFQDPMTALDPAFRVGGQIEETLISFGAGSGCGKGAGPCVVASGGDSGGSGEAARLSA